MGSLVSGLFRMDLFLNVGVHNMTENEFNLAAANQRVAHILGYTMAEQGNWPWDVINELVDIQRNEGYDAMIYSVRKMSPMFPRWSEVGELRDQFAMAALTGYLAHGRWLNVEDGITWADLAYNCADKMLEARKKLT